VHIKRTTSQRKSDKILRLQQ